MTLNDQILQIQMNLDRAKEHIVQLEAGRKASSAKARTDLQKIKVLAHQLRKGCVEHVKSIPKKSKIRVIPTEPGLPSEPVLPTDPVLPPELEAPVVIPKKPKRLKKTR